MLKPVKNHETYKKLHSLTKESKKFAIESKYNTQHDGSMMNMIEQHDGSVEPLL